METTGIPNRVSQEFLYDAVRFILHDFQVLFWGTKSLEVLRIDDDGAERLFAEEFPGLTRKRSPKDMYVGFRYLLESSPREYDNYAVSVSPRRP